VKIASLETRIFRVPSTLPVSTKKGDVTVVAVIVRTDDGLSGLGLARGMWSRFAIKELIDREIAPALVGQDPIDIQRIWKTLFDGAVPDTRRNFHLRAGIVGQAMSAIDQALWDIKGKFTNLPVYRLLGGTSPEIEVYTTFGWNELSRDELVQFAVDLVAEGHDKLKIQAVAPKGGHDIEEDVARVRMVREAVGPDIRVMLDLNCSFTENNALRLARRCEEYNLTFLDDPVFGRDVAATAGLRSQTTVPIATRGAYENIWSARQMIEDGAVDIVQVNVLDGGGYTESAKIAALAELHHLPVAIGGAFYVPNSHLIAGVTNGWLAEYHLLFAVLWDALIHGFPKPQNGRLAMPDTPGIGWELDESAAQSFLET
jgi:L-alanine-DL-glutamate epimerase-like enolase superfamily enzyme